MSTKKVDPCETFHSEHYIRHNQRRQEHLAALDLPIRNKTVLEVGAGIGDHTSFFTDRGCQVLVTEARPENMEIIEHRFTDNNLIRYKQLDANNPVQLNENFDIVYCYGLLYHLSSPESALEFMAAHCKGLLLLETCVTPGDEFGINPVEEQAANVADAYDGKACRPSRSWVWEKLKALMPYVYCPVMQPAHEEFPLDWDTADTSKLTRSVFIASRGELRNVKLSPDLLASHQPMN